MKRKLFTSNFNTCGGSKCVAICLYPPKNWKWRWFRLLAPDPPLLSEYKRGIIDNEEYAIRYYTLLNNRRLSPLKVFNELGNESVLLCYEKSTEFCHRHLLVGWFGKAGIEVTEI